MALKEKLAKYRLFRYAYYAIVGPSLGDTPRFVNQRPMIVKLVKSFKGDGYMLDNGCGNGLYTPLLIESSKETIAIDVQKSRIKFMKKIEPDAFVVLGDSQHLPFKENIFSMVLCLEVIEHLSDDARGFWEIRRVLKNSGGAIISVPNICPHDFFKKKMEEKMVTNEDEFGHKRFGYTRCNLVARLSQFELNVKECHYCLFYFSQIAIAFIPPQIPACFMSLVCLFDRLVSRFDRHYFDIIVRCTMNKHENGEKRF